ncbi:MAG: acetate kinase [Alphaproteobacteria bacterium]|nr:acetate kinase [Alphaproteobacteria bacterium]
MYILALNCGSSSLKYKVFEEDTLKSIVSGTVEKIGLPDSFVTQKYPDGTKQRKDVSMQNHNEALGVVLTLLREASIDMNAISAVGHRVVMGGDKYASSVEVNDEVIKTLTELSPLAPLHNPSGILGIVTAQQLLPNAKQVAVFDTAFHQTMPDYAYRYAVPEAWYKDLGVRRYGFHGTSHLYVSKRAAAMLDKPADKCNLITAHIGSGASMAAIKNGKCIDTSMGMTPTAGLTMGTRTGDIDPSIVLYVMGRLGITAEQMTTFMNKQSGLLGLTQCSSDRRDVEGNKDTDDKCRLALDVEVNNVKKYIGAYMAELGGNVDAIVFTAGVGENDDWLREQYCSGLEGMGIKLDKKLNSEALARKGYGDTVISTPDSKIKIMMIPTDEELVIAEDARAIKRGTYNPDHLKMDYSFAKLNSKQR